MNGKAKPGMTIINYAVQGGYITKFDSKGNRIVDKDLEPAEGEDAEEDKEDRGSKDTDWICSCRPYWDIQSGRSDNEDDNEEDEEDDGKCCGKGKHRSGKLADRFPDHTWVFTKKGVERRLFWLQERMVRDQDEFDMYIYNDFTGYGTLEVMENQVAFS